MHTLLNQNDIKYWIWRKSTVLLDQEFPTFRGKSIVFHTTIKFYSRSSAKWKAPAHTPSAQSIITPASSYLASCEGSDYSCSFKKPQQYPQRCSSKRPQEYSLLLPSEDEVNCVSYLLVLFSSFAGKYNFRLLCPNGKIIVRSESRFTIIEIIFLIYKCLLVVIFEEINFGIAAPI
jgi:hypothetical protein